MSKGLVGVLKMKEEMQQTRLPWADIAKGIGMICIILGHHGIGWLSGILFTFHVPIFFLISGYFLSTKESFAIFAKKRAKSLLVPYVLCSMLVILARVPVNLYYKTPDKIPQDMFDNLIRAIYGSGTVDNHTLWGIGQIGAIWFLLAMFWAQLVVRALVDKKWCGIVIALVAIASYISSKYIWLPFDIQAAGTAAVFVYIGAIVRKRNVDLSRINWIWAGIGGIALVLEVHFHVITNVVKNQYDYTIVSMLGAMLISYSVITISNLLGKVKFLGAGLSFVGSNSVIILCFHLLELNSINWPAIMSWISAFGIPNIAVHGIVFIVRMLLILVCTYFTQKIVPLRRMFGK